MQSAVSAGTGEADQTSKTIYTSQHDGAASDLAKDDGETWPEVQRNNAGIQMQANLKKSMFLTARGLRAGPINFSSNRTQTGCQINAGVASQQECESPSVASKPRLESQRKSVEWL